MSNDNVPFPALVEIDEVPTKPVDLLGDSPLDEDTITNPFQLQTREERNFRFFEELPGMGPKEQLKVVGQILMSDPENTVFPFLLKDDPDAFQRLIELKEKGYYKDGVKVANVLPDVALNLAGYYIGKRASKVLEFLQTQIEVAIWQSQIKTVSSFAALEAQPEMEVLDNEIIPILMVLDILARRPLSEMDLNKIVSWQVRNVVYLWVVIRHLLDGRQGIDEKENARKQLVVFLHKLQEDFRQKPESGE